MKKFLLLLILPLMTSLALAAPFLESAPYAANGPQPDAASFTVNGGAPVACQLVARTEGIVPRCDLASIANPGAYTLVLTVTAKGGVSGGNTYTQAGSASSAPFSYTLRAGVATPPVVRLVP